MQEEGDSLERASLVIYASLATLCYRYGDMVDTSPYVRLSHSYSRIYIS
jgi:hypothetical protein